MDPAHFLHDLQEGQDGHDDEEDLQGKTEHRHEPVLHHLHKRKGGRLKLPGGCFKRRFRVEEKRTDPDRDDGSCQTEEGCFDGVNPGVGLDDALLDEVVADEKKNGDEGHLPGREGEDGHGRNAAVNVRQHPDDEGQGGRSREADQIHERLEQEVQL